MTASKETLIGSAVAATVAAVGISLAARSFQNKTKSSDKQDEPKNATMTELLSDEAAFLRLGLAPISTITWFEGNHEEVVDEVKARVEKIIEANPWIPGHFLTKQGKAFIVYNNSLSSTTSPSISDALNDLFIHVSSPEESPMRYGQSLAKQIPSCQEKGLLAKYNNEWHQPFWKVAIAPCQANPSSRFAILVSMSHVVGDGHTFYALHNMLLGGQDITSLKVSRLHDTNELRDKAMGGKTGGSNLMGSLGMIICMIRGTIVRKLRGDKLAYNGKSFLVDREKIESIKREYAQQEATERVDKEGRPSYISTNDIISSWFLSKSSSPHGAMAINFRKKLPNHSDDMAGNYENCIYYHSPDDTASPSFIRKSVQSLKRSETGHQTFSSLPIALSQVSIVTNWATFCSDTVNLKGCSLLLHVPGYILDDMPSTLAFCIIFRAKAPDQLGVMIAGTDEVLEALGEAPFESSERLEMEF